jgi:hypothetical protein
MDEACKEEIEIASNRPIGSVPLRGAGAPELGNTGEEQGEEALRRVIDCAVGLLNFVQTDRGHKRILSPSDTNQI